MPLDLIRTQFAQRALNPILWTNSARRLIEVAEHLSGDIERFWQSLEEDHPVSISVLVGSEYQNIFMMLYGFAIENLCKAYIVTQLDGDDRRKLRTGVLPRRLNSHNLQHLVTREIRMELGRDEKEILKRIEATVRWAGRYPVSTGPGETGQRQIREQLHAMPQGIVGDDVPRTRQLTARIKSHVADMLRR